MTYFPESWFEKTLRFFAASELVEEILIISQKIVEIKIPKYRVLEVAGQ